jgi:hypothetical protein
MRQPIAIPRAGHGFVLAGVMLSLLLAASRVAAQQAPFLEYDFEDGSLSDFINPNGVAAIDLCGEDIPGGEAEVEDGELLITNDEFLGLAILALDPERVAEVFPSTARNYELSLRVSLESVNELSVYARARIGFVDGAAKIDSRLERGYVVSIVPGGVLAEAPDGLLALTEFSACHELVPHPEWPGATPDGFASIPLAEPIFAFDWYRLGVSVEGDDDAGPVTIGVRLFAEDDELPMATLTVVDPNGLDHSDQTLSPEADAQFALGTSFDFGQQPLATCRVDDISFTALDGCDVAPLVATRAIGAEKIAAEGAVLTRYEAGETYSVALSLSDPRGAGACAAATAATILERVPNGWTIESAENGGAVAVDRGSVSWNVAVPAGLAEPLSYVVRANGSGRVDFAGEIQETGSDRTFVTAGDFAAVDVAALPPVSDFGSIQRWLVLGPFLRSVGGANPGEAELARDYLTDGVSTEAEIRPVAGDTIDTDFGGEAASTGLAPNSLGRNPDDRPTWIEWRDFDDADDRIDFERVYGAIDEVMCYAVTYLEVEEELVVNLGVSSDDAVQILLDGEEIHKNNVARGALGRSYQDTPFTHPNLGEIVLDEGQHVLVVKVFEGGGEHNFRVGFLDELGVEIPGGPEGLSVVLQPGSIPQVPIFRRGDADSSGKLDISDAVFTLNYLFIGGGTPQCIDAADSDDDGTVQITDAIRSLGFLFLGGTPIAPPGPEACGPDPVEDQLALCLYAPPDGAACP